MLTSLFVCLFLSFHCALGNVSREVYAQYVDEITKQCESIQLTQSFLNNDLCNVNIYVYISIHIHFSLSLSLSHVYTISVFLSLTFISYNITYTLYNPYIYLYPYLSIFSTIQKFTTNIQISFQCHPRRTTSSPSVFKQPLFLLHRLLLIFSWYSVAPVVFSRGL